MTCWGCSMPSEQQRFEPVDGTGGLATAIMWEVLGIHWPGGSREQREHCRAAANRVSVAAERAGYERHPLHRLICHGCNGRGWQDYPPGSGTCQDCGGYGFDASGPYLDGKAHGESEGYERCKQDATTALESLEEVPYRKWPGDDVLYRGINRGKALAVVAALDATQPEEARDA